jgi:hypothetical protein
MTPTNWIALASVLVGLLTPVALAVLGLTLNKRLKQFERTLDAQRRASETRFTLYKDIGFKLNDLYSYYMFVGKWKRYSLADIVERKREIDSHVFTYRPIFSPEFGGLYDAFMAQCFRLYGGMGKDAKLRTTREFRLEENDPSKAECFTEEDNRSAIFDTYSALMAALASEVGLSGESDRA